MADREHGDLQAWIGKLHASALPIFTQTVQEVSGVASRRESSASDLADVIGHDASLSARLLKIANSPMFNLQNRNIDTISSAVVLIGFDAIRELAVSLALIEQVLKGKRHAQVTRGMSRAFHAAAQARAFAASRKDPCPEEVFVAALLRRIGEMAFWSVAGREAVAIEQMIQAGSEPADAERTVLGFRLDDLTRRLAEEWHLGSLIQRTIAGENDPRVASVELGHQVAAAVEQHGWNSAEVRRVVERAASLLGMDPEEAAGLVRANAEQAARDSGPLRRTGCGIVPAGKRSARACSGPGRSRSARHLETNRRASGRRQGRRRSGQTGPDGHSAGCRPRTRFFATLSSDGSLLKVSHALGGCKAGTIRLQRQAAHDLFRAALTSGKLVQVSADNLASMQALLTPEILQRVATPFAIMPIRAGDRPVALLYADDGSDGQPINAETLSAFRHFGRRISLALGSGQT